VFEVARSIQEKEEGPKEFKKEPQYVRPAHSGGEQLPEPEEEKEVGAPPFVNPSEQW